MKLLLIALIAASAGTPAFAQYIGRPMPMPAPAADGHAGHGAGATPALATQPEPHAGHDMETMPSAAPAAPDQPHAGHRTGAPGAAAMPPEASPPPAASSGPEHAADVLFDPVAMARAREELRAEQGERRAYRVLADRLEAQIRNGQDGYLWDAQGWYGGDINKLWMKAEGEGRFGERTEDAELQALWSRAITPWSDLQAGLRYDFRPDPSRRYLVAGLQSLVPYFLEVDAAAFLSDEGEISARLEAEYDLLITQRLVLQPRAEVNLAAQDVRERGIGSGVNDVELGLRLRYEVAREFAPYVGVSWDRKLGDTADFARDEGEEVDVLALLVGVRVWF